MAGNTTKKHWWPENSLFFTGGSRDPKNNWWPHVRHWWPQDFSPNSQCHSEMHSFELLRREIVHERASVYSRFCVYSKLCVLTVLKLCERGVSDSRRLPSQKGAGVDGIITAGNADKRRIRMLLL